MGDRDADVSTAGDVEVIKERVHKQRHVDSVL